MNDYSEPQRVNSAIYSKDSPVLSVELRGETLTSNNWGDLRDALIRWDTTIVGLKEHHHFHQVRVNTAVVRQKDISAAAEIYLDLSGRSLIPEDLL